MKKGKKNISLPLQIISQKPGKEDCSFIAGEDHTQTASLPHSEPISEQNDMIKKSQSEKDKKNNKKEEYKENKKKKESLDSEKPKIIISSKYLGDTELLYEQAVEAFRQHKKQLIRKQYTQQNIKEIEDQIMGLVKKAINKVIDNVEVKQERYPKQSVPIQVELDKNFQKVNEISQNMLGKATFRLNTQKRVPKIIKFNPQIPNEVSIKIKERESMPQNEYFQKGLVHHLQKEQEKTEQVIAHQLDLHKKFQGVFQVYKKSNLDLSAEMNSFLPKKANKPKIKIFEQSKKF